MDIKFYVNRPHNYEYSEIEFPIVLNDYKKIIDVFIFLINTLVDEKIKDKGWKYFSETLAIKFSLSANSLCQVINGSQVESSLSRLSTRIFDISSLYILMRAQIENYLTFYYLYIQPKSEEEQEFRFLIYEMSGLENRQRFDTIFKDLQTIQINERRRIEEILIKIKNNRLFHTLSSKQKADILKNKHAKIISWSKLLEESDLVSSIFKKAWLLYSNFAHSEYASLIQIKGYFQEPYKTLSTRNLIQFMALVLISIFVKDFITLYPEIENRYSSIQANDKEVIEFFNGIGRRSISLIK